jgi:glycine/serine hydroxymethyltransferase
MSQTQLFTVLLPVFKFFTKFPHQIISESKALASFIRKTAHNIATLQTASHLLEERGA